MKGKVDEEDSVEMKGKVDEEEGQEMCRLERHGREERMRKGEENRSKKEPLL